MNFKEHIGKAVTSLKEETWKWIIKGSFAVIVTVLYIFRDWAWNGLSSWATHNPLGLLFFALSCLTITSIGLALYWLVELKKARSASSKLVSSLKWKDRYESVPNSQTTVVFRLKEEFSKSEGLHLICPVCYFDEKHSLLIPGNSSTDLACRECKIQHSISLVPKVGAFQSVELLKAAQAECQTLKRRLEVYEPEDLLPIEENLIAKIAQKASAWPEEELQMDYPDLAGHRWDHHLDRLRGKDYITRCMGNKGSMLCALSRKGRDFAIAQKVI